MTLSKQAQSLDGFQVDPEDLESVLNSDNSFVSDDLSVSEDDTIEADVLLKIEEPAIIISLPSIPGAEDQSEIEEPELEVEEDSNDIIIESDPWKTPTPQDAISWIKTKIDNIPKHSGKDILGCERAIAYLNRCIDIVRIVAKNDINGAIDMNVLENARNTMLDGVESLKKRLQVLENAKMPKKPGKKKKASENTDGFVKEARMPALTVQVPLFISKIARIIINGSVSAGHNSEDIFSKMVKE